LRSAVSSAGTLGVLGRFFSAYSAVDLPPRPREHASMYFQTTKNPRVKIAQHSLYVGLSPGTYQRPLQLSEKSTKPIDVETWSKGAARNARDQASHLVNEICILRPSMQGHPTLALAYEHLTSPAGRTNRDASANCSKVSMHGRNKGSFKITSALLVSGCSVEWDRRRNDQGTHSGSDL